MRRFRCRGCGKTFSKATFDPCYRQRRRDLNAEIKDLLVANHSQRGIAIKLKIDRKTVGRKLRFLAAQAKLSVEQYLKTYVRRNGKFRSVQFDDLETVEITNAKPVAVTLIVSGNVWIDKHSGKRILDRKLIGFTISRFRPKTKRLARISKKKYGYRPDERVANGRRLFESVKPYIDENACFSSDQLRHYPKLVKHSFPRATHERFKSRKATVAGQGELKEKGYDPLFPLNHTCAMLRANVSRLIRRTWCTTKSIQALEDHLYVYMDHHNRVRTPSLETLT